MWLLIKQTQNFKWKYDINIKRRYEQNLFLKKKNEQGHLVKPLIHNKHTSEHYFGRDFHLVRYLLLAYVWVNLSMYMLPFQRIRNIDREMPIHGSNCRREVLIYYYRFMNGKKDVSPHTLFMNSLVYFRYHVSEMKYFEALYFLWILINFIKSKIEKNISLLFF